MRKPVLCLPVFSEYLADIRKPRGILFCSSAVVRLRRLQPHLDMGLVILKKLL